MTNDSDSTNKTTTMSAKSSPMEPPTTPTAVGSKTYNRGDLVTIGDMPGVWLIVSDEYQSDPYDDTNEDSYYYVTPWAPVSIKWALAHNIRGTMVASPTVLERYTQ